MVYWSKRDWREWRRRESSKHITRKERKYSLYKKRQKSRQIVVRARARRQTGDGWMDVGFFDVNARGNTSSIMATTAVVNFYILRATSPIPRNPILQPFCTHSTRGGCPPHGKQELCGYASGTDQKLRESFLHQLIICYKIKCSITYCLMDGFIHICVSPCHWKKIIKCTITSAKWTKKFLDVKQMRISQIYVHEIMSICLYWEFNAENKIEYVNGYIRNDSGLLGVKQCRWIVSLCSKAICLISDTK